MILKQYPDHSAVFFHIPRLEDEFRKKFKRAPKSQLVYSQGGDPKYPVHSLALWDGEKYGDEVEFFVNSLK